jgi:hypothetical protein
MYLAPSAKLFPCSQQRGKMWFIIFFILPVWIPHFRITGSPTLTPSASLTGLCMHGRCNMLHAGWDGFDTLVR